MINVMVVFGGESCEHEISIITGEQFISKMNAYLYNVIPVYITKNGDWIIGRNFDDIDNFPNNLGKVTKVGLLANDSNLYQLIGKKYKRYQKVDVAVICLHGKNGEDGSVASILDISKIPYINSAVLPSAVALDKITFRNVCKGMGLATTESMYVYAYDFDINREKTINEIVDFGLPIIAKPSRQGSSIGIKIVKNKDELLESIESALTFDDRLLIERFVDIKKEVNIACFLYKNDIIFSKTEEPIAHNNFLSYDDKYLKNSGGFETIKRICPAQIFDNQEKTIKEISKKIYKSLDMFGVVRFDFLITNDDQVLINEVNTIPGSMANYLFEKEYNYPKLIEMWISSAVIRSERLHKLKNSIDTNVLDGGFGGFKK